ncbi:MAG: D-alanyl-D-alanine carboxypeptidase [Selenomonadaceae bacterium]|nr:D-alanyl-D-alanine carboxypeptidase [Selenomonadaceae bacterium]
MYRIFTAIIFSLFIFSLPVQAAEKDLKITADSAILIEATTGRVIYEKNADIARPPASMTKMMTCILGLENLFPDEMVTISQEAAYTEDSDLQLQKNDVLLVSELLRGMMLVSDNGGAVAIAETISGDVKTFSDLMNEKALEIGCTNTHFENPNGLPNENHYSTARDMAKIAAYCMDNWDFRDIVSTQRETIHWLEPSSVTVKVENTNKLLGKYKGISGIKTGWTRKAGGCLAASAKRGDIELIAIIMHATDTDTRFKDAEILLDYGFDRVSSIYGIDKDKVEKKVFVRDGKKATLEVGLAEDLNYPLLKDEYRQKLTVEYKLPKVVDGGIKVGDIVGKANLKYNGKVVASVPFVARENVERGFSFASKVVAWSEPFISVAENFLLLLA